MFLEKLGFECYYNRSFENYDEILVMTDDDNELVARIADYSEQWGFIPYHFALNIKKKGTKCTTERISAKIKLSECIDFTALQGNFQLILFTGKGGNYLWKTYTTQSISDNPLEMTAKLKAVIAGMNGEVLNLVSHCRLKEV